jgi:hypothetical protein
LLGRIMRVLWLPRPWIQLLSMPLESMVRWGS